MLYMPHVVNEAELMLNNLLPYLRYMYREDVLALFMEDAKKEVKED